MCVCVCKCVCMSVCVVCRVSCVLYVYICSLFDFVLISSIMFTIHSPSYRWSFWSTPHVPHECNIDYNNR